MDFIEDWRSLFYPIKRDHKSILSKLTSNFEWADVIIPDTNIHGPLIYFPNKKFLFREWSGNVYDDRLLIGLASLLDKEPEIFNYDLEAMLTNECAYVQTLSVKLEEIDKIEIPNQIQTEIHKRIEGYKNMAQLGKKQHYGFGFYDLRKINQKNVVRFYKEIGDILEKLIAKYKVIDIISRTADDAIINLAYEKVQDGYNVLVLSNDRSLARILRNRKGWSKNVMQTGVIYTSGEVTNFVK